MANYRAVFNLVEEGVSRQFYLVRESEVQARAALSNVYEQEVGKVDFSNIEIECPEHGWMSCTEGTCDACWEEQNEDPYAPYDEETYMELLELESNLKDYRP